MLLKCKKGQRLTDSEQIAINYINDNVELISNMTITEIAREANVSPGVISHAIKKCGVESMSAARHQLALGEIMKKNIIVDEILSKLYNEMVNTLLNIDSSSLLKIVQMIREAKKVHVLACGISKLVAEEFVFHLQLQGVAAYVHWDPGMVQRIAQIVTPDDLIVVFSAQYGSASLLQGVRNAKEKGIKIVSCHCIPVPDLEELFDVYIEGETGSLTVNDRLGVVSRLGLYTIAQAIVAYMGKE